MLGLDVLYDPDADDSLVRYTSKLESRFVLTKDRRLSSSLRSMAYLIDGDNVGEEFTSVVPLLRSLDCLYVPLSRCLECNTELTEMARAEAEGRVPRYVYASCEAFRRCSKCRRIYWAGTHTGSMLEGIKQMLEEIEGP